NHREVELLGDRCFALHVAPYLMRPPATLPIDAPYETRERPGPWTGTRPAPLALSVRYPGSGPRRWSGASARRLAHSRCAARPTPGENVDAPHERPRLVVGPCLPSS